MLLILVLLENVNIIDNGNWFGPMEPIAYIHHNYFFIIHILTFVCINAI